MKTKTASSRNSKGTKSRPTSNTKFKSVDEYISLLPSRTRVIVKKLRKTIKQAAPEAKELISYNIPAFKLNGMLIFYAVWKEHISLYPRTVLMEAAIKDLAEYEGGKGTIKFPLDSPLPLRLISRIVKFRVWENIERAKKKMKKKE